MSDEGGLPGRNANPPPEAGSMSGTFGANSSFQGNLTVGPPIELQTKPFDPEPRRENIRAWLAGLLVAAFLFLTGFLVVAVTFGRLDMATAKDLAALALTPLLGLTGTAIGFYYAGTKR